MARILTLEEAAASQGQYKGWAYSALDAIGTREIADTLLPRLDAMTGRAYAFERAAQAPALYMMARGVRVNVVKRAEMANELGRDREKAVRAVGKLPEVANVWTATQLTTGKCPKHPKGKLKGNHKWPRGEADTPERKCELCGVSRVVPRPFEATSPQQGMKLFYEILGVPPMKNKQQKVSLDDDVLGRIGEKYPEHFPIVEAIQRVRDLTKQLGFLKAKLSPANRFHASVNVGAAWTYRWSTSKNPYGWGANMQNVGERHRSIFVADAGYTMFYADLERAESDLVAHLAGDERYIEAHRLGDPHTYVARLLWPELPWTGDLKQDKKIAKQLPEWDPVPGHDFRFQAKRIQHGGNYGLKPFGIAMIAHIPLVQAKRAFHAYHDEFPGISAWQNTIRDDVQNQRRLVNPLGLGITLFGRPLDEHTYKQGLSFKPQSTVANLVAIAIYRMWKYYPDLIELQMQVHDATLGQFLTERMQEAIPAITDAMTIPFDVTDIHGKTRRMTIGVEVMTGQNFGKFDPESNPKGLRV